MDLTVDLVVLGCGAAGAAAAVAAAIQGAVTLVLDAAPPGDVGGNSRVSAQSILHSSDAGELVRYLRGMGLAARVPERRLEVWAESCASLPDWLSAIGVSTQVLEASAAEYPNLPGAPSLVKLSVVEGSLWQALFDRLAMYDVSIWAPVAVGAVEPSPRRPGVEIRCSVAGGRVRRILSRYGVILATGGFAGSPEALRKYAPLDAHCANSGSPYNKGDLLPVLAHLGVQLSGMGWTVGPYLGFMPPGFRSTTPVLPLLDDSMDPVVVDQSFARIETHRMSKHGYYWSLAGLGRHKASFPQESWLLCSESYLARGPLVQTSGRLRGGAGWARGVERLCWSGDNGIEVKKGWLNACAIPKPQLDAIRPRLEEPSTLDGDGETFALRLTPTILNTQGGPLRDHESRIVDHSGHAIPGLFGAGESGAIFQGLYQGSGNLADCLVSARLAVSSALG